MEYDELIEWLETCPTHKWEIISLEKNFATVLFNLVEYDNIKEIEILDSEDTNYSEILFDEYD